MDIRTALIADPNEEVAQGLAQALLPDFRVICCVDGLQALKILQEEEPELLILELSLPKLDGIGLLRELSRREQRPQVLVLTIQNTDFVLGALQELPVDYVMRKPCPSATVAQRCRELVQPRPADPLSWQAADLMLRLSIPETSQGYRHMLVGLPMLATQSEQFLGKTLYMGIARQNRVSYESVEKAIRDALRAGWEKGDRNMWLRYFPGSVRCPQNKQFLTRMAALLARQRRCG